MMVHPQHGHSKILRPVLTLALLTALTLALMPVSQARVAGTIAVTTEDDEFGSDLSECSLREAIQSLNTDTDFGGCVRSATAPYTITLPAGTYRLTRLGVDDTNSAGDLDILAAAGSVSIAGTSSGSTVIRGPGIVVGTDRVLHIDPASTGGLTVNISDVTIEEGYASDKGGGVYIRGANVVNITDCVIADNQVTTLSVSSGGGIHNAYGGTLTLTRTIVTNNEARAGVIDAGIFGGGIYSGPECVTTLIDSTVSYNTAQGIPGPSTMVRGGGIFNLGGTVTLDHSVVEENRATGDASGSLGMGGGLYNASAGTIVVNNNSNIAQNKADLNGGGIFNEASRVEISNSTLFCNQATGGIDDELPRGGGLYNSAGGVLIVHGADITSNQAATTSAASDKGEGGGLYNDQATADIAGTNFSDNLAEQYGGGIHNWGMAATVTTTGTVFDHNQATWYGGGFYNLGAAVLLDTLLFDNRAIGGAGLLNENVAVLDGCRLFQNVASGPGGGLWNDGGLVRITDSSVEANQAYLGGGIENTNMGETTILSSTISANVALANGGGIVNGGGALLVTTNTTISGNRAEDRGGGLENLGTARLSFVTIAANVADSDDDAFGNGGGIWGPPSSSLDLKNSIIAANSDLGGEAPDCDGTLDTAGHVLVQDITNCTLSGSGTKLTGVDPLLGALADNGGPTQTQALGNGSPAIDAVTDCTDLDSAAVTVDQRGVARPQRAACDLGAFERQPERIYLPLVLRNP